MAFSESLVVQILGDSSGLRRELEAAAQEIDNLQTRLSNGTDLGGDLSRGLLPLEGMMRPLEALGSLIERVRGQLLSLATTPVTLNVAPALFGLQQLIGLMQQAAAQLRFLGSVGGGWGGATAASPVRGFAGGGLVTGPSGIDRIPARLSAGEFVLNREAVQALGEGRLSEWNRGPSFSQGGAVARDRAPGDSAVRASLRDASGKSAGSTPIQQTSFHYGGIAIQVRETADLTGLLRDLRREGVILRNRRG